MMPALDGAVLPEGVHGRFVDGVNGLRVHLLEAGEPGRPVVLLLHGFPELAYSWRKVMPGLAAAGFHVIAPDQRGYGRTTGWDGAYDGDLASFRVMNLVADMMGLLRALGIGTVRAVVGHDFGASVAAWCALLRPDVYQSVALMSAPFGGVSGGGIDVGVHAALAALARPRKHYQWYYSTREADADMVRCRQGLQAFLRAYYHHKSADWAGNRPFRLAGWTAVELAAMPTYYIMDRDETMAQVVAREMPSAAEIAACRWLPDHELRVYSEAFGRTGFQGALQWYRCRTQGVGAAEQSVFAGRTIDVRSLFIAGACDWGIYQAPGAIERMREVACPAITGFHLIEGAGHWVQQEQPEVVVGLLTGFLAA